MKNNKGYSLLEIMIVVSIISLLIIAILVLLDPKKQYRTFLNTKKKHELNIVKKTLENRFNDREYYPEGADICSGEIIVDENNNCFCHICGNANNNTLKNYFPKMLCDPDSPTYDYLYQFDCSTNHSQWYKICAFLPETNSSQDKIKYNYGVASDNINPEECKSLTIKKSNYSSSSNSSSSSTSSTSSHSSTGYPKCTDNSEYYCYSDGICNNCGNADNCLDHCTQKNPIYIPHNGLCDIPCDMSEYLNNR